MISKLFNKICAISCLALIHSSFAAQQSIIETMKEQHVMEMCSTDSIDDTGYIDDICQCIYEEIAIKFRQSEESSDTEEYSEISCDDDYDADSEDAYFSHTYDCGKTFTEECVEWWIELVQKAGLGDSFDGYLYTYIDENIGTTVIDNDELYHSIKGYVFNTYKKLGYIKL